MDQVPPFQRICVFCGSCGGKKPIYTQVAEDLGNELVKRGIDLVYGGGSIGLMGTVAQAVQDAGGHVIGVIPMALLPKEVCGKTEGDLVAVDDIYQRKSEMASRADAFIALPGGFGTFEEFLEIITWAQLGIHKKPIGLLNVEGYYDSMFSMFDKALKEGFVNQASHNIVIFAPTLAELLDKLKSYTPLVDISVPELQWATVASRPVKRQHNGSSGTASSAMRGSTTAASSASGARAFRALPNIVSLATTGGRCGLVNDVRCSGLLRCFQPPHAHQFNIWGKLTSICGASGVSMAAVPARRPV